MPFFHLRGTYEHTLPPLKELEIYFEGEEPSTNW